MAILLWWFPPWFGLGKSCIYKGPFCILVSISMCLKQTHGIVNTKLNAMVQEVLNFKKNDTTQKRKKSMWSVVYYTKLNRLLFQLWLRYTADVTHTHTHFTIQPSNCNLFRYSYSCPTTTFNVEKKLIFSPLTCGGENSKPNRVKSKQMWEEREG